MDAQKIQDQRFEQMTLDQRFQFVTELWWLAVALAPEKFPYAAQGSRTHDAWNDRDSREA